ncbi:hypothetical protein [Paraflavitalea pollutisoli]|uniref:hypothetical protein n=1 Tax=Paraflavitalea pollutisoli TaxID=3034143 RepID=UPI0023EB8E0E|nr:hypothetical protein [Paraflavitalea sp. H1-2-19X]
MSTIHKYVLCLIAVLMTGVASAQAPYVVTVKPWDSSFAIGVQSFAWASYEGKLLIVGGRTNGFHRTSDKERTFPSQYDNQQFRVIDLKNKQAYSADIPGDFLLPLRTTNMAYYQDGNTLYFAGGYGSTCNSDSASCYQTFPNLTAIQVAGLVNAIVAGQTTNLEQYLTMITDERMRVTGGGLEKIGDYFYLVFGQNFNSIYKGGISGIYTEEIRQFRINNSNGQLSISDYSATTTPLQYQGMSQFHRRDLNIFPTILPNGTEGIGALGGVFTQQAGPYPNPLTIAAGNGSATAAIDTGFQQKFCLYDCARMLVYDPRGKNMYATLFGGITDYYYDKSGKPVPSNMSNFMPFFNHLSTVGLSSAGTYTEYPQYQPALPGYIGSNASFIPLTGVATYGRNPNIIDYSTLPPGKAVQVGWIYGGITATAPQSSEFNPTFSNKVIYAVYVTRNSAAGKKATPKPIKRMTRKPSSKA